MNIQTCMQANTGNSVGPDCARNEFRRPVSAAGTRVAVFPGKLEPPQPGVYADRTARVVIAIIAIPAAMLAASACPGPKIAAQRASCINNEKQVGAGG